MSLNLEQTVDAIVPYMREQAKNLPVMESPQKYRAVCFPVGELAEKTGTSPRMIGKLRKRFKNALARALSADGEFEVLEWSYFGKSAIAVRRARDAV